MPDTFYTGRNIQIEMQGRERCDHSLFLRGLSMVVVEAFGEKSVISEY